MLQSQDTLEVSCLFTLLACAVAVLDAILDEETIYLLGKYQGILLWMGRTIKIKLWRWSASISGHTWGVLSLYFTCMCCSYLVMYRDMCCNVFANLVQHELKIFGWWNLEHICTNVWVVVIWNISSWNPYQYHRLLWMSSYQVKYMYFLPQS